MAKKIIIVHDRRVYDELKRQARTNRKFAAIALVGAAYIYWLTKAYQRLDKKIREINTPEGE